MFVALTGLHGAGKSFLAEVMSVNLGWNMIVKRDVFKLIFEKSKASKELTWEQWYRVMYEKVGAFAIMEMILGEIGLMKSDEIMVIDSVHNVDEWRAIKCANQKSILIGVFTPREIRCSRNNPGDEELDRKRIMYYHENVLGELSCLFSEVEWSFSGCDSRKMQLERCLTLEKYLKNRISK